MILHQKSLRALFRALLQLLHLYLVNIICSSSEDIEDNGKTKMERAPNEALIVHDDNGTAADKNEKLKNKREMGIKEDCNKGKLVNLYHFTYSFHFLRDQSLVSPNESIEKLELRLQQTANGRNDHVTMFILHLPLAVFSSFT